MVASRPLLCSCRPPQGGWFWLVAALLLGPLAWCAAPGVPTLRCGLLALMLLLTACGGGGDAVAVSGVLRQTGGPSGASQPGVPGTVAFRGAAGLVEVEAAEDGTFLLRLPPGTYEVPGRSPNYGGGEAIYRAIEVRVVSAPVIDVVVACTRR